jgi:large subunit ribosomal protein L15
MGHREKWGFSPGALHNSITKFMRVGQPSSYRRYSEETEMAIRNLSNLRAPKKANENKKRVGRGMGSGMGKTSTRGHKGQGSRSGSSLMRGFEGGQMPLHRRLPKRGFNNIFRTEYTVLGLDRVAEILTTAPGTEFTLDTIISLGLLRKKGGLIKVLNNGELTGPVTIHAHKFSKTAQEAIEKAGGKAILIG